MTHQNCKIGCMYKISFCKYPVTLVYYIHNMLRSLCKYFDDDFRGISKPGNQITNYEVKIDNQTADHEVKIAKEKGMYAVFDTKHEQHIV